MFGQSTFAIVVPKGTSLCTLMGEALQRLHDDVIESAKLADDGDIEMDAKKDMMFSDLVRASAEWRTDDMGRDSIVVY